MLLQGLAAAFLKKIIIDVWTIQGMKKQADCESYSIGNNNEKLHQCPRKTVSKLLMIVLKNEKHHTQFTIY